MSETRVTTYEKLSYGMGDFAYSLIWNLVGAFLLYFYTDVALLPAAAIGTLFLTARIFDAAVDLGVGVWVDKTRSRWGRARPFFLFFGLPFCVLAVLTFYVPDWSTTAKLIWAFVTFNLLGVAFSLGTVPLSALLPMMSVERGIRLQLSSWRAGLTAVSVIVATAATMPLVGLLGGANEQRGFLLLALIFALVSLVLIVNLFRTCRERYHDDMSGGFTIGPTVWDMLRNRAWLVTFLFAVLNFIRFGAVLSVTAYFGLQVLHAPWTISILLPAVSGTLLLGAVIAPPILRRFGIRYGCVGAIAFALAVYMVLPFTQSRPVLFVALFVIASIAVSLTMTAIFTMAADSVDYHEWKTGSRNEGLLSSGISLATKVGMALGTAGVAYTLAAAGYHAGAVTGTARSAIRWSYYAWPVTVHLLQIICILFWPMDGQHDRMRTEIDGRKPPAA